MTDTTEGRFVDRHVLVTGAGSGIGRATAARFATEGARLLLVDRDADALAAVGDNLRGSTTIVCDQSRDEDRVALAEHVDSDPVDVCFANAGYGGSGPFLTSDLALLRRHLDINVFGTAAIVQLAARSMVAAERPGAIVVTGSTASIHPTALLSHYAVAKAGVVMLVRALAEELGPHGIRINAILPGTVRTAMTGDTLDDSRARDWTEAETPLGRLGTADDVAGAVTFLASADAAYITGTSLLVDGGSTIHGFPRWYARDSRGPQTTWMPYHEHVGAVQAQLTD